MTKISLNQMTLAVLVLLTGCASTPVTQTRVIVQHPAPYIYTAPPPQEVVSVYVEPPLYQPPPVRVQWAPPPMLVESIPYQPYPGAVWTGGYWVWEGNWVWAHGRWSAPPQPGYAWVNPYYENRGGSVLFINGFWAAPGVGFVPPAPNVTASFAQIAAGVIAGPRPIGPDGVFVPPPPGSRYGLIVPAPLGTAPAVVIGAPPVINEGMRIHVNNNSNNTYINNSVHTNNVTNNVANNVTNNVANNVTNNITNNVTNVRNITNVTIVAPASATANGQAVNATVPGQAHLAAAMTPVVRAVAPEPVSAKPIAAYVAGHAPLTLPPPQTVHSELAMVPPHRAAPDASHPQEMARPAASPSVGANPAAHVASPPAAMHPASEMPAVTDHAHPDNRNGGDMRPGTQLREQSAAPAMQPNRVTTARPGDQPQRPDQVKQAPMPPQPHAVPARDLGAQRDLAQHELVKREAIRNEAIKNAAIKNQVFQREPMQREAQPTPPGRQHDVNATPPRPAVDAKTEQRAAKARQDHERDVNGDPHRADHRDGERAAQER